MTNSRLRRDRTKPAGSKVRSLRITERAIEALEQIARDHDISQQESLERICEFVGRLREGGSQAFILGKTTKWNHGLARESFLREMSQPQPGEAPIVREIVRTGAANPARES